jgi:ribosomal protein L31
MKTDIHPDYKETTIGCACGNVTAGRIERFRKKYEKFQQKEKPNQ